jgi:hypothetical protein
MADNNNNDSDNVGVIYGFKHYVQNGMGADLVRLTGLLNMCEINDKILHFAANDIWDHTPKTSPDRSWTFYFEPTIPADITNSLPRITFGGHDKTILPENKKHLSKFQYRSELLMKIYVPKKEYMNISLSIPNEYPYFTKSLSYI